MDGIREAMDAITEQSREIAHLKAVNADLLAVCEGMLRMWETEQRERGACPNCGYAVEEKGVEGSHAAVCDVLTVYESIEKARKA